MNEELHPIFAELIQNPDRASLIEAVDTLIFAYNKSPKTYVHPNKYKDLKPLVEEFAFDPVGWLQFIRELTNEFEKRSLPRMQLQAVYRRINARVDAIVRRERAAKAVESAIAAGFIEAAEGKDYSVKVTQLWSLGRRAAIATANMLSERGKLSAEERADIYDAFWENVERQIKEQQLPKYHELDGLLNKALEIDKKFYGDRK